MTTISSGLKAETSGRQRIANQMSLIRIALTGLSLLVAAPCMAQGVPDAAQGEIPTCEGFACLDWDRIILEWIRTPGAIANLGSIDIQKDLGGRLDIFVEMSKVVAKAGNQVSILGPCVSACTMAVAFIQQDHLCFGRNASLGFHLARDKDTNVPNLQWSQWMIDRYPIKIRQWIQAQGGVKQMSVEKVWYLYAPDLWKMGYRRCAAEAKNSRPP